MPEYSQSDDQILVLDTSFLIASAQGHYWAFGPSKMVRSRNLSLIMPTGVEHEFKRLMRGESKKHIDTPFKDRLDADGLMGGDMFFSYIAELQAEFDNKLNQRVEYFGHRDKPLSRIDKTVIQAACDVAIKDYPVSIVSGDEGIINQLQEINLRENRNIGHYSPWRIPRKQEEVGMLLTDQVYSQMRAMPKDATKKYFAIAKDVNIGGEAVYDIAFAVYTNKKSDLIFPRIDGSYFMRIFEFGEEDSGNNFNSLTMGLVPIYYREGGFIEMRKVAKPLTSAEAGMIQARRRARRVTPRDRQRLDEALTSEPIKLAIIRGDDIKRHDSLSALRLEDLVRRLKAKG